MLNLKVKNEAAPGYESLFRASIVEAPTFGDCGATANEAVGQALFNAHDYGHPILVLPQGFRPSQMTVEELGRAAAAGQLDNVTVEVVSGQHTV